MDGKMFEGMITALIVFCLVIGFLVGGVVFVAIPWLWDLLKPWMHAIAA